MNKQDFLNALLRKREEFSQLPAAAEDARDGGPMPNQGEWVEPTPMGPGFSGMPLSQQIGMLSQGMPVSELGKWLIYGINLLTMDDNATHRGDLRSLNTIIIDENDLGSPSAYLINKPGVYTVEDYRDVVIAVDTREFKVNDAITIVPFDHPSNGFVNRFANTYSVYKYNEEWPNGYTHWEDFNVATRDGLRNTLGFSIYAEYPKVPDGLVELVKMQHNFNDDSSITGSIASTYNYSRRGDAIVDTIWNNELESTHIYGTSAAATDMPRWNESTGSMMADGSYSAGTKPGEIKLVSANPVSYSKSNGLLIGEHNSPSVSNGSLSLSESISLTPKGGLIRTFYHDGKNYAIVGGSEANTNTDQTLSIFKLDVDPVLVSIIDTTGTSGLEVEVGTDRVIITEFQTNGAYTNSSSIRTLTFIPSRNELVATTVSYVDMGVVDYCEFFEGGVKYYFVWGDVVGPTNVALYRRERNGLHTKVAFDQYDSDSFFNETQFVSFNGYSEGHPVFTIMHGSNVLSLTANTHNGMLDFRPLEEQPDWFDISRYGGGPIGASYDSYKKSLYIPSTGSTIVYQQRGVTMSHTNTIRPILGTRNIGMIPDVMDVSWQTSYNHMTILLIESIEYILMVNRAMGAIDIVSTDTFQTVHSINVQGVVSADYYSEGPLHRIIASLDNGGINIYELGVSTRALSWKEYSLFSASTDNQPV